MSGPAQHYRYRDPGAPPNSPQLSVRFEEMAMINAEVTAERGIQTYDNVLIAYVAPTGQPKSDVAKEIERTLPDGKVVVNRENSMKYAEQVRHYKAGNEAEALGTPLRDLIGMTPAVIQNLKALGIHTLEMLGDCPDSTGQTVMGFWDLRDRAKKHIELREKNAPALQLEAAMIKKDQEIATLRAQLEDLAEAVKKRGPRSRKDEQELEAA